MAKEFGPNLVPGQILFQGLRSKRESLSRQRNAFPCPQREWRRGGGRSLGPIDLAYSPSPRGVSTGVPARVQPVQRGCIRGPRSSVGASWLFRGNPGRRAVSRESVFSSTRELSHAQSFGARFCGPCKAQRQLDTNADWPPTQLLAAIPRNSRAFPASRTLAWGKEVQVAERCAPWDTVRPGKELKSLFVRIE